MNTKPTFKLFGFSVTEDSHGFAVKIKKAAVSEKYSFDFKAVGGITFKAIPYIADLLEIEGTDFTIFEISTCRRFSKTEKGYRSYLNLIAGYCQSKGSLPCFIQLFRKDEDYKNDLLTSTIRKFCADSVFPCLSLIEEIESFQDLGQLGLYLRDGIHTTELGAQFYADRIMDFMNTIANSGVTAKSIAAKMVLSNLEAGVICVEKLLVSENYRLHSFKRGNLEMKYVEISEGANIQITLPEGFFFAGLVYLKGPKTGWLKLVFDDLNIEKEKLMFDQKSHYEHYACWLSAMPSRIFTLEQTARDPEIVLDKGDLWAGPRQAKIAAVLTIREREFKTGAKS